MQATMRAGRYPTPVPAAFRWLGRGGSVLVVLMLALDGATKVLRAPAVLAASAQVGFAAGATVTIGALLLACLAVYLAPRTAPLGAALLTGYLGGAVATHVRLGSPAFALVFPVVLGALLWGGLYLRDARVRVALGPRREPPASRRGPRVGHASSLAGGVILTDATVRWGPTACGTYAGRGGEPERQPGVILVALCPSRTTMKCRVVGGAAGTPSDGGSRTWPG